MIILEANARAGKKLLATGNGRCNLTNRTAGLPHYHGDAGLFSVLFERYPAETVIQQFAQMGLVCRELEAGRVYPYNLQASSVLGILRWHAGRLGIEIQCNFPVEKLEKTAGGYRILSSSGELSAGAIILAAGGKAYPQLGANGSGFLLAKQMGHSVTKLFPALVQVTVDTKRAKPLKGARSLAEATFWVDGRSVRTVQGEVQFTEKGLSGICIFELSRLYGENLGRRMGISLDLMPDYSMEQIFQFLSIAAKNPELDACDLLDGCINKLVGKEIVRSVLGTTHKKAWEVEKKDRLAIAGAVKGFYFPVLGTLGWESAQITAGGVPGSEVYPETLESKKSPGLYLAGELLNIDGNCGGFNLHWAWISGMAAGKSAARGVDQ